MSMKIIKPIAITDASSGAISVSANGTRFSPTLVAATVNVPRINFTQTDAYDAGAQILIENASTNLLLRSEEFNNAAWTKTAGTFATDLSLYGPRGNATATYLRFLSSADNISQSVTSRPAGTYVFSIFLGTNALDGSGIPLVDYGSFIKLDYPLNGGTASASLTVFPSLELVTVRNGVVNDFTIQKIYSSLGSMYRVSIEIISDAVGTITATVGTDSSTNSNMVAFGAMLELGNLTSYIQTVAATVTRTADVIPYNMYSNIPEPEAGINAWSSSKVYSIGEKVISLTDHNIYESVIGSSSFVTMTIASPCVVSWTAHGLTDGTPIQFSTTGALPTNLDTTSVYYVKSPTTNSFNVALSVGGAAINTSGSQSGTHTAKAGNNYSVNPALVANSTIWLLNYTDNKWAMFDNVISNQTIAPIGNPIICTLIPSNGVVSATYATFVDSVALLNIRCNTLRVVCYDVASDGTISPIYDKTMSGIDSSGVTDWYAYFFEPITYISDIVLTDLPRYRNMVISICLVGTIDTPKCGECIVGQSKNFGALQSNAKLGLQDYTIKERDTFGNYQIVERAFSNKANFTVWVPSTQTDIIKTLLASYRATPILYIGDSGYKCTYVYGFYKDFSVVLSYPTVSIYDLELEGLI